MIATINNLCCGECGSGLEAIDTRTNRDLLMCCINPDCAQYLLPHFAPSVYLEPATIDADTEMRSH